MFAFSNENAFVWMGPKYLALLGVCDATGSEQSPACLCFFDLSGG